MNGELSESATAIIHRLFVSFCLLTGGWIDAGEILDPYSDLSGASSDIANPQDLLTFTNTARWDAAYLAATQQTPTYLPKDWKGRMGAAEPPSNSSLRTRAELDYLLALQAKRTAQDVQRITHEITLAGFVFDGITYADITDEQNRPLTRKLAKNINAELTTVMMATKRHFNRVRPHHLEPRLTPCIDVPAHPAYPSGHATQAYVWAYLLCELLPTERHRRILAGAQLIGQDRELAGVHYPSDTALGKSIARQIVDMWLENPHFRERLDAVRSEW